MDERVLLRMEQVSKSFPGVKALDNVSLDVQADQILGLIGENCAGKSTLMKTLSGVYPMDGGQVLHNDAPAHLQNPHQAQSLGISIIHQEFNLMPNISVKENIFVGREAGRDDFVDRNELRTNFQKVLDEFGVPLNPNAIVCGL